MITRDLRSYEVSVWSLQDDFLIVLKHANKEHKNQIQEPDFSIDVDGTEEFSFSIPMYISVDGKKVQNPLWQNYKDGLILANLRKIKIILNKHSTDEEVFEFLITKVTEEHKNNQLICKVACEGLAFQELGKTGYKIELSSEQFQNENLDWFQGTQEQPEPRPTLQYWCESSTNGLGLKRVPQDNTLINPAEWYYDIQMDWSAYSKKTNSILRARDTDKVYEEEYVSSWEVIGGDNPTGLAPKAVEYYKEKERLVDLSESNKYNLTQDLAEQFGIYCKYVYEHDDQYHITARKIIFYNNFMLEKYGTFDITYKYNTAAISRELDGTEIISKMFVRPVDSSESYEGSINIMTVDANKSREDYLLNFDYLHEIGTIDDSLYQEVPKYEAQMRRFNLLLEEYANKLLKIEEELPEVQAKKTFAINAAALDQERLNSANDLLNSLTKDGTDDTAIEVTENNPAHAVLLVSSDNLYHIKLSEPGIRADTVHVYKTFNSVIVGTGRLTNEIQTLVFEYDDLHNLTGINFPTLELADNESRLIYLIYNYVPKLQYERVAKIWSIRLQQDTENVQSYTEQETELLNQKSVLKEEYTALLAEKKAAVQQFELLMGAALREGYWQPEDYNDYGDNYLDELSISLTNTNSQGQSHYTIFEWDIEAFDEEQKIYYESSAAMERKYYLCIPLIGENGNIIDNIYNKLDSLSLLYYDYKSSLYNDYSPKYRQSISLHAGLEFCFIQNKLDSKIIPVLLITGIEKLSDTAIKFIKGEIGYTTGAAALGRLYLNDDIIDEEIYCGQQIINNNGEPTVDDNEKLSILVLSDTYQAVYPRIKISSLSLKNSTDQLALKYGGKNLEMFKDYTLLIKGSDNQYVLTIKPEVFASLKTYTDILQIKFTLSNANTNIYLDALQVLKDSSQPQVEYTVEAQAFNKQVIRTVKDTLSRICCINDWELHFDNVYGYISQLHLMLDKPSEDKIVIKNYKTKFEDLFKKIVASVEQMKKAQFSTNMVSNVFSLDGTLSDKVLQQSINRADLNYAFNNGSLTINEADGILCTSNSGVVAIRGGGIFTATQHDTEGNWKWNTGILPSGLNADLITSGQLDTNLIKIYAGDKTAFQWNADGLYAYKIVSNDANLIAAAANNTIIANALNNLGNQGGVDTYQYVVHNNDGLFLVAEKNALILNSNKTALRILPETITRVEISWDGLKLRNWQNEVTFYANPDTGNLFISGTLDVERVKVVESHEEWDEHPEGVDVTTLEEYVNRPAELIEGELKNNFNVVSEILGAAETSIDSLRNLINEISIPDDLIPLYSNLESSLLTDRKLQLYGASEITFHTRSAPSDAVFSLTGDRLLFGVASTNEATVVDMTKDYIILAASGDLATLSQVNSHPDNETAGVKITKNGIWLATQTVNSDDEIQSNIISLDENGITLASGDFTDVTTGIIISPQRLEIASTSNLIVNTNNLVLDTQHKKFRLGPAEDPNNSEALSHPLLEYTNIDDEDYLNIGANAHIGGASGWTIGTWARSVSTGQGGNTESITGASLYSGEKNTFNADVNGIYLGTDGIALQGDVSFNIKIIKSYTQTDEGTIYQTLELNESGGKFSSLEVDNLTVHSLTNNSNLNLNYQGATNFYIKCSYDISAEVDPPLETDDITNYSVNMIYLNSANQKLYKLTQITGIDAPNYSLEWENIGQYSAVLSDVFVNFSNHIVNDNIMIYLCDDIAENVNLTSVSGTGSITILTTVENATGSQHAIDLPSYDTFPKINGIVELKNNSIEIIIGDEQYYGPYIIASTNASTAILIDSCSNVKIEQTKIQGYQGTDTIACNIINQSNVYLLYNELYNANYAIKSDNLSHLYLENNYGKDVTNNSNLGSCFIKDSILIFYKDQNSCRPEGTVSLINSISNINQSDITNITNYWYDNSSGTSGSGTIQPVEVGTIEVDCYTSRYRYQGLNNWRTPTSKNDMLPVGAYYEPSLTPGISGGYSVYYDDDLVFEIPVMPQGVVITNVTLKLTRTAKGYSNIQLKCKISDSNSTQQTGANFESVTFTGVNSGVNSLNSPVLLNAITTATYGYLHIMIDGSDYDSQVSEDNPTYNFGELYSHMSDSKPVLIINYSTSSQ